MSNESSISGCKDHHWRQTNDGSESAEFSNQKLDISQSPVQLCRGMGDAMHTLRLSVFLLSLPLAGCFGTANSAPPISDEQMAAKKQELAAKDDETCKGYGARPGSEPYVQCRMKLDQSRTVPKELKCTTMNVGVGMNETVCR